jgi:L-rhamnose mutarotase
MHHTALIYYMWQSKGKQPWSTMCGSQKENSLDLLCVAVKRKTTLIHYVWQSKGKQPWSTMCGSQKENNLDLLCVAVKRKTALIYYVWQSKGKQPWSTMCGSQKENKYSEYIVVTNVPNKLHLPSCLHNSSSKQDDERYWILELFWLV